MIKNRIRHEVSTTYQPETDGRTERRNRELTAMFAAHEVEGTDWRTAAPKVRTQMNITVSKSKGQSPFFTLYGCPPKVSSIKRPQPIPVYSDPAQRHYSAAENLNSANHYHIKYANKHRRPAKYHEKGDELMLSTKNLPADKFKLSKLSPTWTGPFKVLEYNLSNQHVTLDSFDFPDLSNISNKFYTSLLKPFIPNDDIHFPDRQLNRRGTVDED